MNNNELRVGQWYRIVSAQGERNRWGAIPTLAREGYFTRQTPAKVWIMGGKRECGVYKRNILSIEEARP